MRWLGYPATDGLQRFEDHVPFVFVLLKLVRPYGAVHRSRSSRALTTSIGTAEVVLEVAEPKDVEFVLPIRAQQYEDANKVGVRKLNCASDVLDSPDKLHAEELLNVELPGGTIDRLDLNRDGSASLVSDK